MIKKYWNIDVSGMGLPRPMPPKIVYQTNVERSRGKSCNHTAFPGGRRTIRPPTFPNSGNVGNVLLAALTVAWVLSKAGFSASGSTSREINQRPSEFAICESLLGKSEVLTHCQRQFAGRNSRLHGEWIAYRDFSCKADSRSPDRLGVPHAPRTR
jgi:hypothetical protein